VLLKQHLAIDDVDINIEVSVPENNLTGETYSKMIGYLAQIVGSLEDHVGQKFTWEELTNPLEDTDEQD
jgi:hypothetical protein